MFLNNYVDKHLLPVRLKNKIDYQKQNKYIHFINYLFIERYNHFITLNICTYIFVLKYFS